MNIRLHVCFFALIVWFWWILKYSNPGKNAMKFYIIILYRGRHIYYLLTEREDCTSEMSDQRF